MSCFLKKVSLTLCALSCIPGLLFAQEVKLNGASTAANGVINPFKDKVEKATSLKLIIETSNTGKGLVDLADGKCDASMTSEPLEIAVAAAQNAGKTIDPATLQLHQLKTDEIVFVVHPSNPVKELTHKQIKDIHLGTITNWKEVGGPDLPIAVFTDAVTGGTRAMIKKIVLTGEEYGANCKALEAVKFVNKEVSENKGGFGGIGLGLVDKKLVKIVKTEKIVRPLGLITVGAPSANVKKIIDAYMAAVK